MGEIIEIREHKVREFLCTKVGRIRLKQVASFLNNGSICDSFIYTTRSDLVYVEPDLLRRFMESSERDLMQGLDLVLDALQKAPGEIKDLLTTDAEYSEK